MDNAHLHAQYAKHGEINLWVAICNKSQQKECLKNSFLAA